MSARSIALVAQEILKSYPEVLEHNLFLNMTSKSELRFMNG